MNFNDYQDFAARTSRFRGMTPEAASNFPCHGRLVMAALGAAGEAGEFADLVKKHQFHGHPLDHDKAVKELGDILWYIAEGCSALAVTLEDVAAANITKLGARYQGGFSSQQSIDRKPEDREE